MGVPEVVRIDLKTGPTVAAALGWPTAHRIEQTGVVTAYRLIACGTIEEKNMALSAKTRELVADVLGSPEEAGSKRSRPPSREPAGPRGN